MQSQPRRRFFLEQELEFAPGQPSSDSGGDSGSAPGPGGGEPPQSPQLRATDRRHALKVLRMGPGDRLEGLDGKGNAWPLRIQATGRDRLDLSVEGAPRQQPAPGQPGAPLPHITMASAMPKPARLEDMLERLTQLGAARWIPLLTERSSAGARDLTGRRGERLLRTVEEACKQSGRLWALEIGPLTSVQDLLAESQSSNCDRSLAVAQVGGQRRLSSWIETQQLSQAREWLFCVGPEGGWSPTETDNFESAEAFGFGLGPHVLRTETAVEATLAVSVQTLSTELLQ